VLLNQPLLAGVMRSWVHSARTMADIHSFVVFANMSLAHADIQKMEGSIAGVFVTKCAMHPETQTVEHSISVRSVTKFAVHHEI
jgi:hypothetical protein